MSEKRISGAMRLWGSGAVVHLPPFTSATEQKLLEHTQKNQHVNTPEPSGLPPSPLPKKPQWNQIKIADVATFTALISLYSTKGSPPLCVKLKPPPISPLRTQELGKKASARPVQPRATREAAKKENNQTICMLAISSDRYLDFCFFLLPEWTRVLFQTPTGLCAARIVVDFSEDLVFWVGFCRIR